MKRPRPKLKVKPGMSRISVEIDTDTMISAKQQAIAEQRSFAKIVEEALKEYLKKVGEQ
jgi:hypothetical protein